MLLWFIAEAIVYDSAGVADAKSSNDLSINWSLIVGFSKGFEPGYSLLHAMVSTETGRLRGTSAYLAAVQRR